MARWDLVFLCLDVLLSVDAYFLSCYLSIGQQLSFSFYAGQGSRTGLWLQHYVLDPLSESVVTQSGSRSSDKPRSRPGLMPFNLALDQDLGLDPNRGSAISAVLDSV